MNASRTFLGPIISSSRPRNVVTAHPLQAYFILTFGIAWIWELFAFGLLHLAEVPGLIVAAFAPPVAAVLVTWVTDGPDGVHALLRRIVIWRVALRWYAFALLLIPIVGILSFVFQQDGTENLPGSALAFVPTYLLLVVVLATLGGGQEEPGWRGFALPRMQSSMGPLAASVSLGLLWGLWHLPLYILVSDYNNTGSGLSDLATSFLGFCCYTVALALVMTWVFNRTSGSLLLVMLVHGALNANFALAPETPRASWSITFAFIALALVIVIATGGRLGDRQMPLRTAAGAFD